MNNSFADGIEKNWNRDEKAIVEPTNYNKLNKRRAWVRQSLQIGKDGRQKDNQFIHFLTYMLIERIEALKPEMKGKNSCERFSKSCWETSLIFPSFRLTCSLYGQRRNSQSKHRKTTRDIFVRDAIKLLYSRWMLQLLAIKCQILSRTEIWKKKIFKLPCALIHWYWWKNPNNLPNLDNSILSAKSNSEENASPILGINSIEAKSQQESNSSSSFLHFRGRQKRSAQMNCRLFAGKKFILSTAAACHFLCG